MRRERKKDSRAKHIFDDAAFRRPWGRQKSTSGSTQLHDLAVKNLRKTSGSYEETSNSSSGLKKRHALDQSMPDGLSEAGSVQFEDRGSLSESVRNRGTFPTSLFRQASFHRVRGMIISEEPPSPPENQWSSSLSDASESDHSEQEEVDLPNFIQPEMTEKKVSVVEGRADTTIGGPNKRSLIKTSRRIGHLEELELPEQTGILTRHLKNIRLSSQKTKRAETFTGENLQDVMWNGVKNIDITDPKILKEHKRGRVTYFNNQVIYYDPADMTKFRSLFYWHATIFESNAAWHNFFYLFFGTGLCAVFQFNWNYETLETMTTTFLSKIIYTLGFLSVLLLGFYLKQKIKRWWEMRTEMLGVLWDAILNILMTLSIQLGPEHEHIKRKVLRYGLLSHALVYKSVQNTDNYLDDLQHMGLITEEEKDMLSVRTHKPMCVWIWMTQLIRECMYETEILGKELSGNLTRELLDGTNAIRRLMSFIECQFPMAYTHLLTFVVHSHMIALVLVGGTQIAISIRIGDFGAAIFQMINIFFYAFAEKGVLQIAVSLEDPFGSEAMDFPRLFYHDYVEGMGNCYINWGAQHTAKTFAELLRKTPIPNDDKNVYDWVRRNYENFYPHSCN